MPNTEAVNNATEKKLNNTNDGDIVAAVVDCTNTVTKIHFDVMMLTMRSCIGG